MHWAILRIFKYDLANSCLTMLATLILLHEVTVSKVGSTVRCVQNLRTRTSKF